jgi:hypothetical protein
MEHVEIARAASVLKLETFGCLTAAGAGPAGAVVWWAFNAPDM